MKKCIAIILALACLLSLTGCNGAYPEEAVDGQFCDGLVGSAAPNGRKWKI